MDQIEQLLTCPVCLDRFKQPKILPCQHTFCLRPCLQNLVTARSIRCPECRSTHLLPRNGINGLPNNLTIVKFLDLPTQRSSPKEIVCQECGKKSCEPEKCNHCEKLLCENCLTKHSHILKQDLDRAVSQVKRLLPKVSELISDLEERQKKSKENGEAVKLEIAQSVERCISELQSRKQLLMEEVEAFVAVETRSLQTEQENLQLELATMSSFCENAENKSSSVAENNGSSTMTAKRQLQTEVLQLTRQSKEHVRNNRTVTNNIEDKIGRSIKFQREGERSLLCSISDFGGISFHVPSKLSMTFGSDLVINDAEIRRAINREHSPRFGRRADTFDIDLSSYTPTPSLLARPESPNLNETSRNRIEPIPSLNPRFRGNNRRRGRGGRTSNISSYLTIGNERPSPTSSTGGSQEFAPHVTGVRTTLWQYRSKGQVKKCFGMKGSDIGCMNWPRGIAATPDGNIVVADSSNHRIQIFDLSGTSIHTFGSYGTGFGEFDCLAGVTVTSQGWIITSDRYNHRVQIFDSQGRFIRMFGEEGSGEGELSYPWGIATDSMGFVYVCDKDNHRIQVFTLDGTFIRKFGRVGSQDTQFDSPQYLSITQDSKVVVGDSGNHRIQVFDKYGRFLYKFGSEGTSDGQFKYPRGVATDQHGNIIVGDSGNNRIQIFRNDGSFLSSFGSWGSEPGQMKGLEGVAILRNGDIAVSDRENHRIQIF
uniref:RING finger protein nhl-1-like n=1 Tax=Styela clava TaxID=7725 RepID=UPI001939B6DE|nr:RING finger protein nhl-1-like [Styela clava]